MTAFGVRGTPARARVSGDMMMRFGSSIAPTVSGVKRLLMIVQVQMKPPATRTFWPVTQRESSDARKTATGPMSSG